MQKPKHYEEDKRNDDGAKGDIPSKGGLNTPTIVAIIIAIILGLVLISIL